MPPEQENQTNQETPTPPQESVTTQDTQNQEQNNPPAPTQNLDDVHNLYRGVLREQNERARLLEEQLAELRRSREQQDQTTPEQDVELLTTNPAELIRREVQKTIAPLNEQAQQWNRTNQLTGYMARMQNDPRFGFMKYDAFRSSFEGVLNQVPQLNDQSVYAAYRYTVGEFVETPEYRAAIAQPSTTQPPSNQPTTHSQTVPTPPSNRPAPPQRVPTNSNAPKKNYSENEKLLMRMRGMTEEEWERELNLAPSEVIHGGQ